MSTNKHAQIRYQVLDVCFANLWRKYFIEDLIEAVNKELWNRLGVANGVQKRQVQADISYMETDLGVPLIRRKEGRRVYYQYEDPHYSIRNMPLNQEEMRKLRETVSVLSRFKGLPQFEWMDEIITRLEDTFFLKGYTTAKAVQFEDNPYLRGIEHFSQLFDGIIQKRPLKVTYKSFDRAGASVWDFHPYLLKSYNNRWFVFGLCDHLKEQRPMTNLPLDRIEAIDDSNVTYIPPPNNVDFNEYFDDVVGVTINDTPVEHIVVEIDNTLFPYVETKPWHGSQKIKERGERTTTITLDVIINHELENKLFSYIDQISVVAPEHFRKRMQDKLTTAMQKNFQLCR
jgi:predicted DNA-binding transcriptional regulator YafY